MIYKLALRSYDERVGFIADDARVRGGVSRLPWTERVKTDAALIRTCKLAYLEGMKPLYVSSRPQASEPFYRLASATRM